VIEAIGPMGKRRVNPSRPSPGRAASSGISAPASARTASALARSVSTQRMTSSRA
jgi:hypothetical protein